MSYAICNLSVIPVRKEPNDRSEMTTQILFGETCFIKSTEKNWLQIETSIDSYQGWIDSKQVKIISEKYFKEHSAQSITCAVDMVHPVIREDKSIPVLIGSTLPFFDGITLHIEKEKYVYNGVCYAASDMFNLSLFEKLAYKFLNAPYLWGGRSPFGIDCSGFTQIVYKIVGLPLKRDAYQQFEQGKLIDFVEISKLGDLAFFSNDEGKIIHVGIVLSPTSIIHASGRVRIDKLDAHGIYNQELKKYSHKLRAIKRII